MAMLFKVQMQQVCIRGQSSLALRLLPRALTSHHLDCILGMTTHISAPSLAKNVYIQ